MAHSYVYKLCIYIYIYDKGKKFAVGERERDQERHCTGKFDVRSFQVVGLWNRVISEKRLCSNPQYNFSFIIAKPVKCMMMMKCCLMSSDVS